MKILPETIVPTGGLLTTSQVIIQYGVKESTLKTWCRGYYVHRDRRYWLFTDRRTLSYTIDQTPFRTRKLFSPIKLAVWLQKIKGRRKFKDGFSEPLDQESEYGRQKI